MQLWQTSLVENQGFVGSSPTLGTEDKMKTNFTWNNIEDIKPKEGAICLCVFKAHEDSEEGHVPPGIVSGTLKWIDGKWDHPERGHMPNYGRVRQDISHWVELSSLKLDV
jgi:hypothetical protein